MSGKQIKKLKESATNKAIKVTKLFPLWVMRNKYGFGKKRLKEFAGHYTQLIEDYNNGYLDLEDIAKTIEEETGVNVMESGDNHG